MSTKKEAPDVAPDMLEGILAAIETSLPASTCGVLKDRLERLASVEGELVALTKLHGSVCADRDREAAVARDFRGRQSRLERDHDAVIAREHACRLREQACEYREQVNDLKDTHATERVGEMKDLVEAVFANSRFKYERVSTVPVVVPGMPPGPVDQYGNAQLGSSAHVEKQEVTEKVEGEGEAPPA